MEKRIVITVHGVMTRGKWQKDLTPYLARYNLIPYLLDYGFFGAWLFLLPWTREPKVRWLQQEIDGIIEKENCGRVSVIAHSFGTYLTTEILRREPGQRRFDRIVLTGSIVSEEFDWADHFSNKRVFAVRNEIAKSDWVVLLADLTSHWFGWLLRLKAGRSGIGDGFKKSSERLHQANAITDHSGTHIAPNFIRWARFVAYPYLPEDYATELREGLSDLQQYAAKQLQVSPDLVRANLFLPYKGKLHIVPSCCVNMLYAPELELQLRLNGKSCTAMAYEDDRPRFVERIGLSWSNGSLTAEDLKKIAPNLKYVLSFPIFSHNGDRTLGVVNIDGLDLTPQLLQNEQDLASLMELLWVPASNVVQSLLEKASKGEPIDHDENW